MIDYLWGSINSRIKNPLITPITDCVTADFPIGNSMFGIRFGIEKSELARISMSSEREEKSMLEDLTNQIIERYFNYLLATDRDAG